MHLRGQWLLNKYQYTPISLLLHRLRPSRTRGRTRPSPWSPPGIELPARLDAAEHTDTADISFCSFCTPLEEASVPHDGPGAPDSTQVVLLYPQQAALTSMGSMAHACRRYDRCLANRPSTGPP